jgi:hypothetical protein
MVSLRLRTTVTFIVAFWPIAAFLLHKQYPFDLVFYTADLIPVGTILLLASVREIDTEYKLGRLQKPCERRRLLGLFICMILLSAYAVCRYHSFEIKAPEDAASLDQSSDAISVFSLLAVGFCGLYALWLKTTICRELRHKRTS